MKPLRLFLSALFLFTLAAQTGCDVDGRNTAATPVRIHRFDRDLYQLLQTDTPEQQERIRAGYAPLLDVVGKSIFRTADTQSAAFFDRLLNYYAEPTLLRLYRDALKQYEHTEGIEQELGNSFHYLRTQFPDMQIPAVYMHVSGLQQNVIVADSLLSLSTDKYLGADYPLYRDFFPDYRRRRMEPEYIVPDCLTAWLLSEYPFRGDGRVLLERMIYEGKIKYILHRAYPGLIPEMWTGYTPAEYQWCRQNEKTLWNLLIERKHLYTPDAATTARYFSDAPSTFIADDAPGNLGVWIGWQIVTKYMNRTHVSPEQLMNGDNCQEILRKSRYKP
ncbi:MAG: gliding motility protein GldB [Tannerella sp.]|jgi:gliding motility-associated lipoprotein GldB|nr:gliding motility protein GldB [Tannerella sp.]